MLGGCLHSPHIPRKKPMAIFDWKCNNSDNCENICEEITLPQETEPTACPKCKSKKITKCMGAPMSVFVGNGWTTWDGYVSNSIKEMKKEHAKKSYLKTNDGRTTAHDSSDKKQIKSALKKADKITINI